MQAVVKHQEASENFKNSFLRNKAYLEVRPLMLSPNFHAVSKHWLTNDQAALAKATMVAYSGSSAPCKYPMSARPGAPAPGARGMSGRVPAVDRDRGVGPVLSYVLPQHWGQRPALTT